MSDKEGKKNSSKKSVPKVDFFADLKARTSSLQRIAVGGTVESEDAEKIELLPLDALLPNPHQPRQQQTPQEDAELAEDVRVRGVLQPIIVRPAPGQPGKFQLVAGERRYRASRTAGKTVIPAIVRPYDDREARTVAAIENLQRQNLTAAEEAHYFKFLSDEYNLSNRDIAKLINKSPGYVDIRMKLLETNGTKSAPDPLTSEQKAWKYRPKEWEKIRFIVSAARHHRQHLPPKEKEVLRETVRELRKELEELERALVD